MQRSIVTFTLYMDLAGGHRNLTQVDPGSPNYFQVILPTGSILSVLSIGTASYHL